MPNERKRIHGDAVNDREKVYDFLSDNELYDKPYSEFTTKLDTEEGRKKIYSFMYDNGFTEDDYDAFNSKVSGEKRRYSVKRNDGSIKYFDTKEEGDAYAKANYRGQQGVTQDGFDFSLAEPTPMQKQEEEQSQQIQTPYYKTQEELDGERDDQIMPFRKYGDEEHQQQLSRERKKGIREVVGQTPDVIDQTWLQRGKLSELERGESVERKSDVTPFFEQYIKPEFEQNKAEAEGKAKDVENQGWFPSMSREQMLHKIISDKITREKVTDPKLIVEKTMKNISPDVTTEKGKAFNDLILKRMGLVNTANDENQGEERPMSKKEIEAFNNYYGYEYGKIAEEIQSQLYDEYKKAGAPKGTLDYIMSDAIRSNIIVNIAQSMIEKAAHSSGMRRQMRDMALNEYSKNAGIVTNAVSGAVNIATDPLMYAIPGVGSAAAKGVTTLAGKAISRIARIATSKGAAEAATRYALANSQALNIASRAIASGVTLGGISTAHAGAEQFRQGQFNGGELLETFGENALVGAATAGIAGKLESMARFSGRAARVGAAAGGYAVNVGGFSAYQMWEKARAQGKDVSDMSIDEWAQTVGENAVMFGIMDLPKMAKAMRERNIEARRMGMELTPDMIRELEDAGYRNLFADIASMADKKPSMEILEGEKGVTVEAPTEEEHNKSILDKLNQLVKDDKLSTETRRRMYWYATGKMLMPDGVYSAELGDEDTTEKTVSTYNEAGQRVETKTFDNWTEAKAWKEQFDVERLQNMTGALESVATAPARNIKTAIDEVAEEESMGIDDVVYLLQSLPKLEEGKKSAPLSEYEQTMYDNATRLRNKVLAAAKVISEIEGKQLIDDAVRMTKEQRGVDVRSIDLTRKKGIFGKGMSTNDMITLDTYIENLQNLLNGKTEAKDLAIRAKETYEKGYGMEEPSDVKMLYTELSKSEENIMKMEGGEDIAAAVEEMASDGKTEEEVNNEIINRANGDKTLIEAARQFYVALEGLKGMSDRINAMVEARMEEERKGISNFVVQPSENASKHSPHHAGITTFAGRMVYVTGADKVKNPTEVYIIDPDSGQELTVKASLVGKIYEVPPHIGKAMMDGREVYITGITDDGRVTVVSDITKPISNNGAGVPVEREKVSDIMLSSGMVVSGMYNGQKVYVTDLTDDSAVVTAADGQKYVVGSGDVIGVSAISMDELLQLKGVEYRDELESEVDFYARHHENTQREIVPATFAKGEKDEDEGAVDAEEASVISRMGTVYYSEDGKKLYGVLYADNGQGVVVGELTNEGNKIKAKPGTLRTLTPEQLYTEQDAYYQRQDEKKAEVENAKTKPTVETKVEANGEADRNGGDVVVENDLTEGKSSGTDVNGEERRDEVSVIDNQYGYSSKDYEDERLLNEQYSKELSDISSIEDDEKFEEAANALERKLPSGFNVFWNSENGAHIALGEPSVYSDINGTRRKFNIGDVIQLSIDGRNPHIIITNIDESGKVVDAIDMQDGRYVVKNGNKLSANEILNQEKRIADQKDQNGSPYMLNNNGSIDFGMITADKNITEAPVRISLGDAENGYVHIEKRHGKQIRNEGYNGVLEFIQHVLDNFNVIKKGDYYPNSEGGVNQTYYVTLSDEHNNVLFVQLARDESYWNINSAGIFRRGYGKNKETIWSASEVQNSSSATTDNALQSKPNADEGSTSNGTASSVSSGGKDTPTSSAEQGISNEITVEGEEKPQNEGVSTENVKPTEQSPLSSPIADALGMSGKKKENKNSLASRAARLEPDEMGRWEDYVLTSVGSGIKFKTKDSVGSKGIVSHTTGNVKDIPLVMLDNTNGETPEMVAHRIYEGMPERMKASCTDQDVFNEILDIVLTYPSYNAMLDEAEARVKGDAEAMDAAIEEDAKDQYAQAQGFRDYEELSAYESTKRLARMQMERSVAKMNEEQLRQLNSEWVARVNRAQQVYERNKTPKNYRQWELEYERYKAVKAALDKIDTYDNDMEGFFDSSASDSKAEGKKKSKAIYIRYDARIDGDGKEVYTKTDIDGKTVPSNRMEYLKARKANPDIATTKEELKNMKDEYAITALRKSYPTVTDAESARNAIDAIEQQMAEADLNDQQIKQLKDQISDLKKMKRILGAETSADYLMEDPDMQLSDFSEKDQARIREAAKWMTKKDARRMLEMAYNIQKPYLDENISFDNWVKQTPTSEITMIVDNEYAIQETFLNPIYEKNDRFGNDFWSEHLVDAYKLNLLDDGNAKAKQAQRVDLGKAVRVADSRFYAPKQIELAEETLGIARQRVTKSNKAEVLEARQKIILFAHNEGAAETIGMSKAEFNKMLRSWTRESASIREVSQKINKGVEESNRWSGIENMAATNAYTISDEEIERMTGGVEGDSNGMMRRDIARTMLAIDTHTDWSGIKIKFAGTKEFEEDFGKLKDPKNVSGFYRKEDRLVEVRLGRTGHTTPHEMGHALDHTWGLELGFNGYLTHSKSNKLSGDAKLFVDHVNEFITDLIKTNADIRNDYTTDRTEVFARFVDYFVNFTESVANNTPMSRNQYFEDKFTAGNVVEFARILQEKSVLDSQRQAKIYREKITKENEEAKKQNDTVFNSEIDAFKAKEHKGLMHLGKPLAKLQASGINAEELTISPTSLSRHLKKYGLEADDIKGLASAIQDPILVYKHGLKVPNIVVVTELNVKGGKLSVSVQVDEAGNVTELNNVRSVHAKDAEIELERLSEFSEEELRDALKWVEKEKVSDWFSAADLYRPMHTDNPKLDSVAKILNTHKNPDIYAVDDSVFGLESNEHTTELTDLQSEDSNDVSFLIELTDAGNREVWEHGKINIPDKVVLVKNGSGAVVYGADARKVAKELGTEMEGDRITLNGGDVAMLEKTMGDDMRLISYEDAEGSSFLDKNIGKNAVLDDYTNKNAARAITFNPEYEMYRAEIGRAFDAFSNDGNETNRQALVDAAEDYAGALQMVVDRDVERRVTDGAAKVFAKEIAKVEAYIDDVLDGKAVAPQFGGLVKQTADVKMVEAETEKVEKETEEDYFTDKTMPLGKLSIPLRRSEVAHITEQVYYMPDSKGKGWDGVEPNAIVMTSNLRTRYPELHNAAKNGDVLAARTLIEETFGIKRGGKFFAGMKLGTPAGMKLYKLMKDHPNATVVYPHREEGARSNVLGQVYAQFLEDYGFAVDSGIVMINRPGHTDASKDERLLKRSRYEGSVQEGGEYIIIDDHITMGGTVRDMKDFIEWQGGKVVAVSTLTKSMGSSASLVPTKEQINKLIELGVTDEQLKEIGISSGLTNLTKGEAERIQVLSQSGRNKRNARANEGGKGKNKESNARSSRSGRVGGKPKSRNAGRAAAPSQETLTPPEDIIAYARSKKQERDSGVIENAAPKTAQTGKEKAQGTVYKTKKGKNVEYKQLELFSQDDLDGLDKETKSVVETILTPEGYRMEPLGEGQVCHVERRYTENGKFAFDGSEKIKSPDDVAFLFKALEDQAIENAFGVLVAPDGKPTIIHLGIGSMTASVVDTDAVALAVQRIKPKAMFLVHNHPSGKLTPSRQDRNLLGLWKRRYGGIVQNGIIIDTLSGKYSQFNEEYWREDKDINGKNAVTHKVYTFDKLVFGKDYTPSDMLLTPKDVAAYLSAHRLGAHAKTCILAIGKSGVVMGNYPLPADLQNDNTVDISKRIADILSMTGSKTCFIYGDGMELTKIRGIAVSVGKLGFVVMDGVNVKGKFDYEFASSKGILEPDETDLIAYARKRANTPKTVRYKTEDGKTITYKQLDLFDGVKPEGETSGTVTGKKLESYHYGPLKTGEVCYVERQYTKNGMFRFDGSERIESSDDIAYLFRKMQDNATCNTFFVLTDADGKPTIIHGGMGDNRAVAMDISAPSLAVAKGKPEKMYVVINHPWGSIEVTDADKNDYKKITERYGDIVQPLLILDTASGKYGEWNPKINLQGTVAKTVPTEGGNSEVDVYSFDKQVFGKDFEPDRVVMSKEGVVEFLSTHRFGGRPKLGALVMNNQGNITGNFALSPVVESRDAADIAQELTEVANVCEGKLVAVYGEGLDIKGWDEVKYELGTYDITIVDAINLRTGESMAENGERLIEGFESASEKGLLYESAPVYSPDRVQEEENMIRETFGPDEEEDPHPKFPEPEEGELLTDESFREKMDRYNEEVSAWKERQRNKEERSVEDALFSGDATGAPETGIETLDTPERAEQELFDEMMYGEKKDKTQRQMKSEIRDQIRERRRTIETGNFEDAVLVHDIKKVTTPEERKRIPFILEGTDTNPVSDELKEVVDKIRTWFDEMHLYMSEEGLFRQKERKQYVTNYVTHIWDKENVDPDKLAHLENWISKNSPYTRDRIIPTLQAGLDMGLKMKYEDITDIILDYGHRATEAIANRRLVNFLKGYRVDGFRLLIPHEENDADYGIIVNNALNDYKVYKPMIPQLNVVFGKLHWSDDPMAQKIGHFWDVTTGVMKKMNLSWSFFHHGALTETAISMMGPQEFSRVLGKKMLWDVAFNGGELPAFLDKDAARDAVKHFVVLGATQDYAAKDVQNITGKLRKLLDDKDIKGLKEAAVIADAINVGMDTILWDWLHDGYKIYSFKKIADEIRKEAINGIDENGWTIYNEGWDLLKLNMCLDEAGQLVNDTFGGQHWDLLNITPGQVKLLRRALMSGDWTFSTMRQAVAPFGIGSLYDDMTFWEKVADKLGSTITKLGDKTLNKLDDNDFKYDGFGYKHNSTNNGDEKNKDNWWNDAQKAAIYIRKKYARHFWTMAFMFMIPFWDSWNAVMRMKDVDDEKKKAEEMRKVDPYYLSPYELAYPDGMKWWDYTLAGNTYGQRTHIFLGRDSKGNEIYGREGKQYREAIELIYGRDGFDFPEPLVNKVVGKLNPGGNAFKMLITGSSILGYESPFVKNKTGWERKVGMLQAFAASFLPYTIPTDDEKEFTWESLIMPTSKGFTAYKAKKYFETAILAGDMDMVEQVYKACVMNNINADQVFDATCSMIDATVRKAMLDGIESIGDACAMYDNERDPKKRSQLRNYIKKMSSAQDWKQIEKGELIQKAYDVIEGTDVNTKEEKVYDSMSSSDDVVQDWRLSKAITGLKSYDDEYKELFVSDQKEAEAYLRRNESRIRKYRELVGVRNQINKLKKTLGKDAVTMDDGTVMNDAARMKKIRDLRKKVLEED